MQTDRLLQAFADTGSDAVGEYRRFVAEGFGGASPWRELKSRNYLGSEQFVECMQALIDAKQPLHEIPKRQRRAPEKPLAYYASRHADRDRALAEAHRSGAYSMRTIGEHSA